MLLAILIFSVCAWAVWFVGSTDIDTRAQVRSVNATVAAPGVNPNQTDASPQAWAVLLLAIACVLYQGRRQSRRFGIPAIGRRRVKFPSDQLSTNFRSKG